VREVQVGPNTFNITWEVNVLHIIGILSVVLNSCKLVEAATLENSQDSITKGEITIESAVGKSGEEVPGLILTGPHSVGVVSKVSEVEAITIFIQVSLL
jgi:hypothetical protein